MKAIFTDPVIRNLEQAHDADYVCMAQGEPGFGIRIYPGGTMTFFYQYKVDGKRRTMALGNYVPSSKKGGEQSLKVARELYQAELAKVKALRRGSADGVDPVAEIKRQERERRDTERQRIEDEQKEMAALTVDTLASDYVKLYAEKFKKSWKKDEQILNRDVLPLWGKRKAESIKRTDVVSLLDGIVARNAPIMANNTFAVIRKMFNWAVEKGKLENTPCTGLKSPAPKAECDRTLSEAEIKTLWVSLDRTDLNMSFEVKKALKLELVTAQRPGEVAGLHTKEIDGNWWTVPAERSKNKREHRVYLTSMALVLIDESIAEVKRVRKLTGGKDYSGFIFPTPHRKKEQAIGETALPIAVQRNLNFPLTDEKGDPIYDDNGEPLTENRLEIEQFTPHDLRRTASTFMSEIGFMDEIIDAVLNHKKKGIIKTYNKNKYDKEKQMALEAWERKLKSITTSKEIKVIPMQRKAA
jgi:integrase